MRPVFYDGSYFNDPLAAFIADHACGIDQTVVAEHLALNDAVGIKHSGLSDPPHQITQVFIHGEMVGFMLTSRVQNYQQAFDLGILHDPSEQGALDLVCDDAPLLIVRHLFVKDFASPASDEDRIERELWIANELIERSHDCAKRCLLDHMLFNTTASANSLYSFIAYSHGAAEGGDGSAIGTSIVRIGNGNTHQPPQLTFHLPLNGALRIDESRNFGTAVTDHLEKDLPILQARLDNGYVFGVETTSGGFEIYSIPVKRLEKPKRSPEVNARTAPNSSPQQ